MKFLFKPLLALSLLLVSSSAWCATTYKLKRVASVEAGELYVFEQMGHVMDGVVDNSAIQTTADYATVGLKGTETYIWELVDAKDGFYIKNLSIENQNMSKCYLGNKSSTAISFTNESERSVWQFTFEDGVALITNHSFEDRFLGYSSTTSYAYKAYATSSRNSYAHAITVYQLVVDDDTPAAEYTMTWMVNGAATTTTVTEGEAIVYPANPVVDGYVFMGWTTAAEVNADGSGIVYAKADAKATSDKTFYAVFAKTSGEPTLRMMVAGETLTDGNRIVIVAPDVKYNGDNAKADVAMYQQTVSSSYVDKYLFDGNVQTVLNDDKCWLTVRMVDGGFTLGDEKNGYVWSHENNLYCSIPQESNEGEQIWTLNDLGNGSFQFERDSRYLSFREDISSKNWRMGGANYGTLGHNALTIYKLAGAYEAYTTRLTTWQTVVVSSVGMATACVAFDATVSGATAYYVTVADGVAELTEVTGVIPAETGVLLQAETGGTAVFTEAALDEEALQDAWADNMLVGTVDDGGEDFEQLGYVYYILSNGKNGLGFYWDGTYYPGLEGMGAHCDQYKAVLRVPESAATSSNIRIGGTTGVVPVIQVEEDGEWFDLQGRRVDNPTRGLYIRNGQKILVK